MALSERATTAAAGAVSLGVYLLRQWGWVDGWEPVPPETLSFVTLAIATLFSAVANRRADPAVEGRGATARAAGQDLESIAREEPAAPIRAPADRRAP